MLPLLTHSRLTSRFCEGLLNEKLDTTLDRCFPVIEQVTEFEDYRILPLSSDFG